jgi:hypothetical protein
MTEDPREFGLTAADLRTAADRLYEPGDDRLDRIDWTHDTQVRYGQIRSRLRSLADAIDRAVTGGPHDHARPGISDQLATLAAYRAILNGTSPAETHDQAEGGSCPACATAAAAGFGIMLAQELAGAGFVAGPLRARLLEVIGSAEAELRAAGN